MHFAIFTGEPMNGTAAGELIIDIPGGAGPDSTINGAGGDDLILGDGDTLFTNYQSYSNTSLATAWNIDGSDAWSTGNNPIIESGSGPHTSIYIEPGAGERRLFTVTIGAGETIVLDVDFSHGTGWGGTDTVIDLLASDGTLITTNDDNGGDFGSIGSFDSRLSYTSVAGGTYYIRVGEFGSSDGNTFEGGEQIFLNVSVTNHAATASPIAAGDDTISGGLGNDTIFGMLGTDTVHGDGGNDIIVSTGNGDYFGDAGNDTIYAGNTSSLSHEVLDGGPGTDMLDTTSFSFEYVIDLATGVTNYTAGFGESFVNFENLRSGAGNDTLSGTAAANNIRGGAGNDTINGLGGDDVLQGETGDDTLNGGGGNDSLTGGPGVDTLDGGGGADVITATFANGAAAHGGVGIDTLFMYMFGGIAGTINLDGTSEQGANSMATDGFENLYSNGSTANLYVNGTVGANTITTGEGNDSIFAVFGTDILSSGSGDDMLSAFGAGMALDGGDGIDTYNGAAYAAGSDLYWSINLGFHGYSSFDEPVTGTFANIENFIGFYSANDHVRGTSGVNSIWGRSGDDFLYGRGGGDVLFGEDGADSLFGDEGADSLNGNVGADLLDGGPGSDAMAGGLGNDVYYVDNVGDWVIELAAEGRDRVHSRIDYTLGSDVEDLTLEGPALVGTGNARPNVIVGTAGANTLSGLGNSDDLYGYAGDDTLLGGDGHDDLYGGSGADTLEGEGGNDRLYGEGNNDFINGGGGNDNVYGGAGHDDLFGGGGADILNGQRGDDLIVGGPGIDILTGGAGADRFLFNPGHLGGSLASTDRIKDFSSAQGDKIDLHNIDANTNAGGNQAFTWIGAAAFSGAAGELRFSFAGNTTTITGDTDGDGTADFALWLTGQVALTEGDFVL